MTGGDNIVRDGNCSHYYDGSPSVWLLTHIYPPEFWYLAGFGIACAVVVHVLWSHEMKKHREWGAKNLHLKNKTNFLLGLFPIFSFTSLFGLFYVRASVFLEFIHNVYEGFCCVIFLTAMMSHLEILGFRWDGEIDVFIATPPFMCFFRRCMPTVKNTAFFKKILLRMVTQLAFVQAVIEMLRVLYTFECSYDPASPKVVVWDAVSIFSFLIGMWSIIITLRLGHAIPHGTLKQFKYIRKLFGIKVLIFTSKTLYKGLDLLGKKGYIKSAGGFGTEQRARLWSNFITLAATCLTFVFVRRFYTEADYIPYQNTTETEMVEDVEQGTQNASTIENINNKTTNDRADLISD